MQRSHSHAPLRPLWLALAAAISIALPVQGIALAQTPAPANGTAVLAGQTPPVVTAHRARLVGHHNPNDTLTLNLGLPLRNQAQLQSFIDNRANARQPLSQAEFDATYGPTSQQVQQVKDWAASQHLQVSYASPDGLSIIARGNSAAVESAFHVQINDYRDPRKGRTFYSNDRDAQVPASLGLQSVTGLNNFHTFHSTGLVGASRKTMSAPADRPSKFAVAGVTPRPRVAGGRIGSPAPHTAVGGIHGSYYPSDLQALYDLAGHGVDGTGQTIGLTLWGAAVPDSDLAAFATATGDVPMSSGTGADQVQWVPTSGNTGATDAGAGTEIAMDVEYAHGMATHSHLVYYLGDCAVDPTSTTCIPSTAGLEEAISDAANNPSLHIVSNSWLGGEAFSLTDPYVIQTTNSFEHAVAVGTTFYFASGDHAADSGGDGLPVYPADSPYVVAVGGTSLYDNSAGSEQYSTELAWGGSGGGCSNTFARPNWQILNGPATCSGRAIPDLAADGDPNTGVYVYANSSNTSEGGTSLSTPLTAGMAAVTNSYLAQHHNPLMGWAAPTIYQLGDSPFAGTYFHDVTCGSNGYAAGPAWDEATGFGSEDWYQYTLGFAGTAVSSTAPTSYPWTCSNPDTTVTGTGLSLNAGACTTSTACFAVGTAGSILQSGDGGATWTNPARPLYAAACPSTTTCLAVGYRGTIRKTADGNTWVSSSSGVSTDLYGIACPSTSVCYVTGDVGTVLRTTNGGSTWTALSSGTIDTLWSVACTTTTTCWAVGDGGTILFTNNSGASWSSQSSGTGVALYSIACPGPCYAVGDSGTILSLAAGGSTWQPQVSGTSDPLLAVACPTSTACWATGYHQDPAGAITGTILATSNGSTWLPQVSGVSAILFGVSCINATTCLVDGQNGDGTGVVIANTGPAGTWVTQISAHLTSFFAMACAASSTSCLAAGDLGTLLATPDTGTTWTAHTNPLAAPNDTLNWITCADASTCYAVGSSSTTNAATIVTTRDGGASWSGQTNGATVTLNGISCTAAKTCFAVGPGGTILATTDGSSWSAQASGTTAALWSISCLAGTTTCYAVGENGTILKTTGGSAWTAQTSNTANILYGVSCSDGNTCYAVGGSGTILKTIGGSTWTSQTSGTSNDLYGVACTGATSCDAIGVAGTILTTGDGSTWTQSANPFSGPLANLNAGPFNDLFAVTCSTSSCFVLTYSGNVLVAAPAPTTPATYTFSTPSGWYLVGGSPFVAWGDIDASWAWDAFRGHWFTPSGSVPTGTGAWEHLGATAAGSHSVSVQTCAAPVTVTVQPHRWNIVGNPCNRTVTVPAGSRALLYQGGRYVVSSTIPEGLAAWVLPASGNLQLG